MKITFLFFSLLVSQAQAGALEAGLQIHVHASENHCNVDFKEQQRLAIRDLLKRAELECGENLVPVQVGATTITENHSCIHYQLGVTAEATFRCDILWPSEHENQTN